MADDEKLEQEETEIKPDIKEDDEGKEIETTEDGKILIPEVTKEQIKIEMPKLNGLVFKVGDFFFKVSYLNIGQRRFTAEMLNDLKE